MVTQIILRMHERECLFMKKKSKICDPLNICPEQITELTPHERTSSELPSTTSTMHASISIELTTSLHTPRRKRRGVAIDNKT